MSEFTLNCEQCGGQTPESKAEVVGSIGVHGRDRAAYCPECQA